MLLLFVLTVRYFKINLLRLMIKFATLPIQMKCRRDEGDKSFENIFNSDVAKRWGFFPTTHVLTPHIKRKKMQKIILHLASHDRVTMQRKEEKRRRKKDLGERKKPTAGSCRKDLACD
jgi:hypothetical protein